MLPTLFLLTAWSVTGVISQSRYPTYFIREHRPDLRRLPSYEAIPSESERYQLVSVEEPAVPVVEHVDKPSETPETSLLDVIFNPVGTLINMRSAIIPFMQWVLVNGSQVLLGVAITVGTCAFSSSCSISLDNFRRNISMPSTEDLQHYFNLAYNAYRHLGNDTES